MRFETTMAQFGNNTGIEVPPGVLDDLGAGRRPAVVVVVNGYEYRSTVGAMKGLCLIPFSAEHRARSGIAGGDALVVDLAIDTAPREIEVPGDLAGALDEADASSAFAALSPSARKAHVMSVTTAKTPETRARRVAAVVAKLGAPPRGSAGTAP